VAADEDPPVRGQVRARPVQDLAERVPWRQALPLVAVETLGLAVLFAVYWFLDARDSVLAPLLVPPVVSFILVVASSSAPGSRPLRVVVSYLIAGIVGLGVSAMPGPVMPEAVLAGALTMLAMHVSGALHSPAIAVAIIAVLADFAPGQAARALPLLFALAVVVVALAWAAHKLLGDSDYPTQWW
jgi:CBS-domain-containing membrane protein